MRLMRHSQKWNPSLAARSASRLILISFLFAVISASHAFSQTISQNELNASLQTRIHVLARPTTEGIVLRWAVDKPAVWRLAKNSGFIVERAEARDEKLPPENAFARLGTGAVLPWTNEQWEAYFAINPLDENKPDYAMIAAALLEGEETDAHEADLDNLAALREQRARFEMRYGYALYAADRSAAAADGLGLRFVDNNAARGKGYVYRVRFAGISPVYRVDTGYVSVMNSLHEPAVLDLLRAEEGDGLILLTWPQLRYSSYRVMRSEDGGKNFKELTRAPIMTIRADDVSDSVESFLDTLVTNDKPYVYRVLGDTPFGDEERVGEVRAMGRDRTPPGQPFVPNPKHVSPRTVRISWSMDEPVASDLKGFTVLRDTLEDGAYSSLTTRTLPPAVREFIDTTFFDHKPNYYIVAAVDTAGNVARSLPSFVAISDSTPPSIPRWFKGEMDSLGVVTLTLRMNSERDVMGYRILRSNAVDHEFSSVIEWYADDRSFARDTVIVDSVTVMSLTKNVYYRATALDFRYNESEMSEILIVKRPDKVAPVAPIITDVEVTDSSVTVIFQPSTSDDVSHHLLYKKEASSEAWMKPTVLRAMDGRAMDVSVRKNVLHEYAVQAVDSADNASELSVSVQARPYDTGVRPGVTALTAVYDSTKKQVVLSWTPPMIQEEFRYEIYRSTRGSGMKRYGVSDGVGQQFIDTQLRGSDSFEYAVKVVTKSGAESKMSERVMVTIR